MSSHHAKVNSFWGAFASSSSLIIAAELGDKSFLITSIMAAQRGSRSAVFLGSLTAMSIMNALSVCLGLLTTNIAPWIIHYLSVCLFFIFGFKMLIEGWQMTAGDSVEAVEEAQKFVTETEATRRQGRVDRWMLNREWMLIFVEVFSIVFFAEWGDRSQMSTILLAAHKETVWAVGLGAFVGYLVCSSMAVAGSRMVMRIISVRAVTILGGIIFILCAMAQLLNNDS